MRYCFSVIFLLLINFTAFSQQTRIEYIRKYQYLAIQEMQRSGIPASIKMAQACLESADGNSELAIKSNNHFGIKCKSDWTGPTVYYDDDQKNECFRKYKTVEESYIDHTNFLVQNIRYRFLFEELSPTDYKGWARGLKNAGYATANHYANSLIDIIEEYKLYRLDQYISFEDMGPMQGRIGDRISNTMTINPFRAHEVYNINNLEAVVAKENDSYEIIAREFGIESWELYNYNDRNNGYVPQINEVIYIQKKKRKAPKENLTHITEEGETMLYISQMYGIQLKPLYRRNNMKFDEQPEVGQTVYLRKKNRD